MICIKLATALDDFVYAATLRVINLRERETKKSLVTQFGGEWFAFTCCAQGPLSIFVRAHEYRDSVQGTINLDGLEELIRAVIRDELGTSSKRLHGGPDGFFDVKAAAAFLCTSEQALRGLCKRGQIPVHKTPQGRLLFDRAELEAYVRGEAT